MENHFDEEDRLSIEHYIEIGAITAEGVDENGEVLFAITEKAKEVAPELWKAHRAHLDESLMDLYQKGLMEVEYDENLEATFTLSPEGVQLAKQYGLIPFGDFKE